MSYRFVNNVNNIYNWEKMDLDFFDREFLRYNSNRLALEVKLEELFSHVTKASMFAKNLFESIVDDGSDACEEAEFKLSNCQFYMENEFRDKKTEILKGIYSSEETHNRLIEILDTYIEVIVRGYGSEMADRLNQVGRIATSIRGLLDDLEFTLELNDLFDSKVNDDMKVLVVGINNNYKDIRKERLELTSRDRGLVVCA